MKRCPMCAEEIQDAALVCRFCGHRYPEAPEVRPTETAPAAVPSGTSPTVIAGQVATGVGGLLMIVGCLLPWARAVETVLGSPELSGTRLGGGKIVLVLAALIVIAAIARPLLLLVPGLVIISVAVTVIEMVPLKRSYESAIVVGTGVYLLSVGALLALVASVVASRANRLSDS